MHFLRNPLRLTLSLALAILYGCAQAPAKDGADQEEASAPAGAKPAPAEPLPPLQEAQVDVMAGEMAAGRQQPKLAAQHFLSALDVVRDPQLAARATALALAAGDDALAFQASRKWQNLDPTSLDAREVVTRLALRQGQEDEALAQCASIVRDHPGGKDDGFRNVALVLAQEPDKSEAALRVMAQLVAQYPKLAGAYQAQGLLALRFNKPDLAEQAAREALKIKPASKEAALLLVGALVKKGAIDDADQVMEGVLKNNGDANDLRLGYARLLVEGGQLDHGREQLEKVLKADPANVDAHYSLGLVELDRRQADQAEPHFQFLARIPDRAADAEYFLGRIAELRHQPQQALAHYQKVTSGNQALDAVMRRAAMLGKLGRVGDARALLGEMREQNPQLADRFTLAEGQLLIDAGAVDQALEVYGDALKDAPDDGDLLFARSLAYERANRIGDAEHDLRKVLDKSPDDARALNALGYTLAVHTDRLAEADKLVSRALQLTPEDPAVIDSMGWVRYRQGRTQDALPLLQRAYRQFPDAEVAAHLSEVLWSLGNKDKARDLWTQAARDDPENPVLRDTIKRLGP
ncbi:MAG: tetratricopeptide repeat protein [Nevskia sp.]|nr:tetratricopeptide repeat protein [Nevskia sp.]